MNTLIQVKNLGKQYSRAKLSHGRDSLREFLGKTISRPFSVNRECQEKSSDMFWALRHIAFEIHEGEVLGVLGNNGAGKTTLFRLLSQITVPSEGTIEISGRIGTLLGAAAGFHPELTGRENIYLAAAIMGMQTQAIESHFGAIVDFSETGPFLDTPIKHYSSGMIMRLGFSIAVHLLPEILILDEILAVGDYRFQEKALQRTREVARSGHTILFVSHNLETISALCTKVLILDKGSVHFFGDTHAGIQQYAELIRAQNRFLSSSPNEREGSGAIRCTKLEVQADGSQLKHGRPMRLIMSFERSKEISASLHVVVTVRSLSGETVIVLAHHFSDESREKFPEEGQMICDIPQVPLAPGMYNLEVEWEIDGKTADRFEQLAALYVQSENISSESALNFRGGAGVLVPQEWSLKNGA